MLNKSALKILDNDEKHLEGNCRAALETGLAQKREPEIQQQGESSKKPSGMMSAVLGVLRRFSLEPQHV